MSAAQLQNAMAAAEDDGDRNAALGVQAELSADMREFDDTLPPPPPPPAGDDSDSHDDENDDDPGATGAAVSSPPAPPAAAVGVSRHDDRIGEVAPGVAVPAADEGEETELAGHLSRLRDIEKHSLAVLERYLAPLHEAQLTEARQAVAAREEQLQAMRERIHAQVASIASDDEEQLFYSRDEAFRTYMQGAAPALPPAFGPPSTDPAAALYVEPGHLTLYRVGFVAFVPIRPKRKAEAPEGLKTKTHPRSVPASKPGAEDSARDALATVSDNIPLPSAARHSLFRRKEDIRAGEPNPALHFVLDSRSIPSGLTLRCHQARSAPQAAHRQGSTSQQQHQGEEGRRLQQGRPELAGRRGLAAAAGRAGMPSCQRLHQLVTCR